MYSSRPLLLLFGLLSWTLCSGVSALTPPAQVFPCGIRQDHKILLCWDRPLLYIYQHRTDHGMLYRLRPDEGSVDSTPIAFPSHSEAPYYFPEALDVLGDQAILSFGGQLIHYTLHDSGSTFLRTTEVGNQEVIFHAGLHPDGILVAANRPDIPRGHHLLSYPADSTSRQINLTHPLVFLTTFSPCRYFDDHRGKLYFLDNAHYSVQRWSGEMDTALDLSAYFRSENSNFLQSVAARSVREQRALFMDMFGRHPFDLITHLYVDDSGYHLLYFPASKQGERLKRSYCRIERNGQLANRFDIREDGPSGLLGFQAVLIDHHLYWVRAEEGQIKMGRFP